MKNRNPRQLGGIFAALVALAHVSLGATRLFGTPEVSDPWRAFLQDPGAGRWLLLAVAFLLLAVVPAVEQLFTQHRAFAEWLSQLAFLGLFALALARIQDASVDALFYSVDARGWLGMGCLTVWSGCVGLLAWHQRALPRWLSLAALSWASLLAAAMVAGTSWNPSGVRLFLALACFAAAPAWFGGLAGFLLRGKTELPR